MKKPLTFVVAGVISAGCLSVPVGVLTNDVVTVQTSYDAQVREYRKAVSTASRTADSVATAVTARDDVTANAASILAAFGDRGPAVERDAVAAAVNAVTAVPDVSTVAAPESDVTRTWWDGMPEVQASAKILDTVTETNVANVQMSDTRLVAVNSETAAIANAVEALWAALPVAAETVNADSRYATDETKTALTAASSPGTRTVETVAAFLAAEDAVRASHQANKPALPDWSTFVAASGGQSTIDRCIGPVRYTPTEKFLGRPLIGQHAHCGGTWISNVRLGQTVHIAGWGTYKAVDIRKVPSGSSASTVKSMGGQVLMQTCIGSTIYHLVGLNKIG